MKQDKSQMLLFILQGVYNIMCTVISRLINMCEAGKWHLICLDIMNQLYYSYASHLILLI